MTFFCNDSNFVVKRNLLLELNQIVLIPDEKLAVAPPLEKYPPYKTENYLNPVVYLLWFSPKEYLSIDLVFACVKSGLCLLPSFHGF